jgi:integrase/recombinase XerD
MPRLGSTLPKILSVAEVKALMDAARACPGDEGARMRCVLELLYGTELRISKLVTLPLAAVHRDPPFLLVSGKGGKVRVVSIGEPARMTLRDYLECRQSFLPNSQPSYWLFPASNRDGHLLPQQCSLFLKDLAVSAGLDPARVSPQMLRHAPVQTERLRKLVETGHPLARGLSRLKI